MMETEIIVRLKMKGEAFELSHDEARELWRELGKVFSPPVFTFPYQPFAPYQPYPVLPCTSITPATSDMTTYSVNRMDLPLTWTA